MELVFDEDEISDTAHPNTNSKFFRITKLYIMFLFTWQRLFRLSDTGAGVLLAFFATFLNLLSSIFGLERFSEFVQQLPRNTYRSRKYIGHEGDCFKKYVSCPKCHYVYDLDICSCKMPDGTIQSRKCTFVKIVTVLQKRVNLAHKIKNELLAPSKSPFPEALIDTWLVAQSLTTPELRAF